MAAKEQDEKTKRLRELLTSFYGRDSAEEDESRRLTMQGINLPNFDSEHYFRSLLRKTPVDRLARRHVELAAEIKNVDKDLQVLVYENYNKFISATDTIRRMKENVSGMESNMDQLLKMVTVVRGKSDSINASLCERRERIEELNGTRGLLRKVQFVFNLPRRLRKCMTAEDHVGAVKYYQSALPILKAYGKSSFRKCKDESDAIISTLIKRLQAQIMNPAVLLPARAQAVSLLQQLRHPMDTMMDTFLSHHGEDGVKRKLKNLTNRLASHQGLKALETSASRNDLHAEDEKDYIQEFLGKAVSFQNLFPNGEERLLQASTEFFNEYFKIVQLSLQPESGNMTAAELNVCFRQLAKDVTRMNELLPEANLPTRASQAVENAVRKHVTKQFQSLYSRITASVAVVDLARKDSKQPPKTLKSFLEIAQKTIIDGSLDVLQDLKDLLNNSKLYLLHWTDEYTDLIQGAFQELFTNLVNHFLSLCVRFVETSSPLDKSQPTETVTPSLILLVSLLSVYLYQTAVPQITELVGTWFPGGGAMGSEGRPAFVPSEICRFFNTAGERLLQQYVGIQSRTLSSIVRKAVDTPDWLEYKEPQDIRVFADELLQEVERLQADLQQLLPPGPPRIRRNSNISGDIGFSRSTSLVEDPSNARSQSSGRDVARLFPEKVGIFTKLEYNQAWVISAVLKVTLKTFKECVRLQTFNQDGYQQIQLDCHYLKEPLKKLIDNRALVEIMLDEVCSAASVRCQDPVPLDTEILDKIVQTKKSKMEPAQEGRPV